MTREMTTSTLNTELNRLAKLEEIIDRGLQTFVEVGNALMEIKRDKLYKDSFVTFEEYCRERWGWSRQRAYQLIDSAEVAQNLSTVVDILPTTERQARQLAPLEPEAQQEVWSRAVETAPNGKVTAAHVERTKQEYQNPTPSPADDTEELAGEADGYDWTDEEQEVQEEPKPEVDGQLANLYKKCGELFEQWRMARTQDDASDLREELYDTMSEYEMTCFEE